MQEARSYALDPTKFKRDPIRVDLDALKAQDNGPSRDSEDDDVEVDDEEPVSYKTTPIPPSLVNEPLKKKWSRQAEELVRESPSPSGPVLQPPAAHSHPAAAVAASDKGEANLFPLHPLMDRTLYEKSVLSNLKSTSMLTRAT